MKSDNDIENIAYFAAVNSALNDQGHTNITGEEESNLVNNMFKSKENYMDSVNAIIKARS